MNLNKMKVLTDKDKRTIKKVFIFGKIAPILIITSLINVPLMLIWG